MFSTKKLCLSNFVVFYILFQSQCDIYIYTHTHTHTHIYIYIYKYKFDVVNFNINLICCLLYAQFLWKNGSFIDSFNESCFAFYVTFEKLSFSSMFYVKGFICFIFIFDVVCGYMCVCLCLCISVWVSMYVCVRGGRGVTIIHFQIQEDILFLLVRADILRCSRNQITHILLMIF